MSKPHPIVRKLYMVEAYDPQVEVCQGGVGESPEVYFSRTAKVISCWLADGAGELGAADSTDALRFQGDGAGDLRIGPELCTVTGVSVGGDDQGVVLLVPGIKARCAPGALFADGGNAQEMVPAEE